LKIKHEKCDRCFVNVLRTKAHFKVFSGLYGYLDTISGDEDYDMEHVISIFPPFEEDSDKIKAGPRWNR
jgi:hypothetical protein